MRYLQDYFGFVGRLAVGLVVAACMVVWVFFFTGCIEDQHETEAWEKPDSCGLRPGYAISCDTARCTLSRADWERVQTYMECKSYDANASGDPD